MLLEFVCHLFRAIVCLVSCKICQNGNTHKSNDIYIFEIYINEQYCSKLN